jgi:hypothetical protein
LTPSGKLEAAKQIERVPLGFAQSIEKPFDVAGNNNFQVHVVTTYYFR